MPYLFTSESVSEGHPDKVADQISDAVLDEMLRQDPNSRVACETLVTTGLALLAGEVKSKATIDLQKTVRRVIRDIGYTRAEYRFDAESCSVLSALHEQSSDINQGVDREDESQQGAGDQGMMFGYATNETDNFMPLTADISHKLLEELARIRKEGRVMTYLRPDSKSQVTINYSDDDIPLNIQTIVISTQHDDFDGEEIMQQTIAEDIRKHLIPAVRKGYPENIQRLFDHDFILHVNPTGKFVIGGPHGDTGLTGRKIIVDTYGGHGAHGGGAFSGKDSSKVDRSAAYATRHIAKNMVAAGVADRMLVQVAYAIGIAEPVGLHIETYGTAKVKNQEGRTLTDGEIGEITKKLFDLRPYKIVDRFNLKKPIFLSTASYGHFGKEAYEKEVQLASGSEKVTFFGWEKLDRVSDIKKEFDIS
jgi:S-adenosylmethionine synthetase